MFLLEDSTQNVDKIHRATCFAYYCISWIQFKSEVSSLNSRKSHFLKFTFALEASLPIKYIIDQPRFQSNMPPIEYSSRFVFCCFVITVNWSLLKQQDLDTVIIIKISCDNTTENCFFQVLSYFQCLMYQIPLRRLLGKQNIKTKEFMWWLVFHYLVFCNTRKCHSSVFPDQVSVAWFVHCPHQPPLVVS